MEFKTPQEAEAFVNTQLGELRELADIGNYVTSREHLRKATYDDWLKASQGGNGAQDTPPAAPAAPAPRTYLDDLDPSVREGLVRDLSRLDEYDRVVPELGRKVETLSESLARQQEQMTAREIASRFDDIFEGVKHDPRFSKLTEKEWGYIEKTVGGDPNTGNVGMNPTLDRVQSVLEEQANFIVGLIGERPAAAPAGAQPGGFPHPTGGSPAMPVASADEVPKANSIEDARRIIRERMTRAMTPG